MPSTVRRLVPSTRIWLIENKRMFAATIRFGNRQITGVDLFHKSLKYKHG